MQLIFYKKKTLLVLKEKIYNKERFRVKFLNFENIFAMFDIFLLQHLVD